MNMKLWKDWVLLWAVVPIALSFFQMAINKQINAEDPLAQLHRIGTFQVFACSLAILLAAPFFVLKHHVPRYGIGLHLLSLGTIIAGWILVLWMGSDYFVDGLHRLRTGLSSEARKLSFEPPIRMLDILTLPWWKLYLSTLAYTAITFGGPVLLICLLSQSVRSFGTVMVFVLLAGLVTATSNTLFGIFDIRELTFWRLNGQDWWKRISAIATWSASSAIGATISFIGLNSVLSSDQEAPVRVKGSKPKPCCSALMLSAATAVTLWAVICSIDYISGPKGFRSGFAEFRKYLTIRPSQDTFSGQEILRFSYVLDAPAYEFPNPNFVSFRLAPDERTAVLLEQYGKNQGQLAIYGVVSGKRLRPLGEPLARYERSSYLWNKSAEYLAVRSRGALREDQRYKRYETKITLYKLPDYQMVAQWQSSAIGCQFPVAERNGLFFNDRDELVVICYDPPKNAESILAVTLSLPGLEVVRSRKRLGVEKQGWMRPIIHLENATYIPMVVSGNDGGFFLSNLSDPAQNIIFDNPLRLDRGGRLTFQGFSINETEPETIRLTFCGSIQDVSNPPYHHSDAVWGPSFCRRLLYDRDTGSLAGFVDGEETRIPRKAPRIREFPFVQENLEIVGVLDSLDKAGTLVVKSRESGAIHQIIRSTAQIPFAVSPSNGLLFTNRLDERKIAVYRVESVR